MELGSTCHALNSRRNTSRDGSCGHKRQEMHMLLSFVFCGTFDITKHGENIVITVTISNEWGVFQ